MNQLSLSPFTINQENGRPSCSSLCMDATLTTDAGGRLTSCSRGAEELFGYFAADVIGKPFHHFLSGGEAEFRDLRHSLEENAGGTSRSETEVIGKHQRKIPIQLQASALGHESGSHCEMIVICRDLRPIRSLQTEIRQKDQFFASIIRESADAIVTFDARERITSWNKGAETIFGYTEQEMLGRGLEILVPEPLKAQGELQSISQIVRKEGSLRSYHTQRLTKNGEIREVIFTRTAIRDIHGKLIGFSSVVKDITETKRLEQQVAHMEKLSAMGELSAGIAHEIKNPLAGIKGTIEIIRDSMTENDLYRSILGEVISEVNRIDRIVMDLLSYAKPKKPEWVLIDLVGLMRSVTSVLKNMAESRQISFHLELADEFSPIMGDENRLKQLFFNLILNSIQALEQNGVIQVRIRTSSDLRLRVEISDNGPGISQDMLAKIFQPFVTTKKKGTGLGLATCKRIVQDHGGEIHVESDPVQGTRFLIDLPPNGMASRTLSPLPSVSPPAKVAEGLYFQ